jgi:hypothetical protein
MGGALAERRRGPFCCAHSRNARSSGRALRTQASPQPIRSLGTAEFQSGTRAHARVWFCGCIHARVGAFCQTACMHAREPFARGLCQTRTLPARRALASQGNRPNAPHGGRRHRPEGASRRVQPGHHPRPVSIVHGRISAVPAATRVCAPPGAGPLVRIVRRRIMGPSRLEPDGRHQLGVPRERRVRRRELLRTGEANLGRHMNVVRTIAREPDRVPAPLGLLVVVVEEHRGGDLGSAPLELLRAKGAIRVSLSSDHRAPAERRRATHLVHGKLPLRSGRLLGERVMIHPVPVCRRCSVSPFGQGPEPHELAQTQGNAKERLDHRRARPGRRRAATEAQGPFHGGS